MLDFVQRILQERGTDFVRLDGSVPQKKRRALVLQFQREPTCRVFLATNAGAVGLNLQAADTIVNVDLPLEPRDPRTAHWSGPPDGAEATGSRLRAGH